MFTDNPDFYPTPQHIVQKMWDKIENKSAKYFLEPSAGNGNIVDFINEKNSGWRRGHYEINCIESDPNLIAILNQKEYNIVGFDWLNYDGVSYEDVIIMNPPFSNGVDHLLKAWDYLYNGEIICLLNEETIKNPYSEKRKLLVDIIGKHGSVEYLGDCFSDSERKTDVNVALVHLKKVSDDDSFDVWHESGKEKDPDEKINESNYLAIPDKLGNMELFYNEANNHMFKALQHLRKASAYMAANGLSVDVDKIFSIARNNVNNAKAEFVKSHRNSAWHKVFEQTEFRKWLDKKQKESFIREIDRNGNIPFTKENIKGTLQNIFLQRNNLFKKSVANVFDELRKYHADNCVHTEGWKSNSNYKINNKIVFPYGCKFDSKYMNRFEMLHYGTIDIYNDIDRILCVLDNRDFDSCDTIEKCMRHKFDKMARNEDSMENTFETQYFRVKFFKKGTVHLVFKDQELLNKFNIAASEGKNELGSC